MTTYPRTIYFPADGSRVIVNIIPGPKACFSAMLVDTPDGEPMVWGLGDTELAAIADLNRTLAEAE